MLNATLCLPTLGRQLGLHHGPATLLKPVPWSGRLAVVLMVAQRPLAPPGLSFFDCHMAALAARDTLWEARDLRLLPSWSSRALRALALRLA